MEKYVNPIYCLRNCSTNTLRCQVQPISQAIWFNSLTKTSGASECSSLNRPFPWLCNRIFGSILCCHCSVSLRVVVIGLSQISSFVSYPSAMFICIDTLWRLLGLRESLHPQYLCKRILNIGYKLEINTKRNTCIVLQR